MKIVAERRFHTEQNIEGTSSRPKDSHDVVAPTGGIEYRLIGDDVAFQFVSELPESKIESDGEPPSRRGYSIWTGQLTEIASALISSAALASVIVAWIKSKKVKITLKDSKSGKELHYEGKNPGEDISKLTEELANLASQSGNEVITIHVKETE